MKIICGNCGRLIEVKQGAKSAKCPRCHTDISITDRNHSVQKIVKTVEKTFGKKAAKEYVLKSLYRLRF